MKYIFTRLIIFKKIERNRYLSLRSYRYAIIFIYIFFHFAASISKLKVPAYFAKSKHGSDHVKYLVYFIPLKGYHVEVITPSFDKLY